MKDSAMIGTRMLREGQERGNPHSQAQYAVTGSSTSMKPEANKSAKQRQDTIKNMNPANLSAQTPGVRHIIQIGIAIGNVPGKPHPGVTDNHLNKAGSAAKASGVKVSKADGSAAIAIINKIIPGSAVKARISRIIPGSAVKVRISRIATGSAVKAPDSNQDSGEAKANSPHSIKTAVIAKKPSSVKGSLLYPASVKTSIGKTRKGKAAFNEERIRLKVTGSGVKANKAVTSVKTANKAATSAETANKAVTSAETANRAVFNAEMANRVLSSAEKVKANRE